MKKLCTAETPISPTTKIGNATSKAFKTTGIIKTAMFAAALTTSAAMTHAEVIEDNMCPQDNACHFVLNTDDSTLVVSGSGRISQDWMWSGGGEISCWTNDCLGKYVKYLTIEEGISGIGSKAFEKFTTMERVNIPSSVTSNGDNAFNECNALDSVVIPSGVTKIDMFAFTGTAFTSVTIPESVTSIGIDAFGKNLSSMTINCASPPAVGDLYLTGNIVQSVKKVALYVPAKSLAAYQKAYKSMSFKSIQAIGGTAKPAVGKAAPSAKPKSTKK